MPDWFYRTVSQPVLFRLPAEKARNFALGFMGRLARLPLGAALIDFLGHMRADPRLARTCLGIRFPTALGLGPGLDAAAVALPALARFGFGLIEVGPVTIQGCVAGQSLERRIEQEAIWMPDAMASLSLETALPRIAEAFHLGPPLMVRLGCGDACSRDQLTDECVRLIQALAAQVHHFSLLTLPRALAEGWEPDHWRAHIRTVLETAQTATPARPVLWCVPCDLDREKAAPFLDAVLSAGASGLVIDGSVRAEPTGRLIGLPARQPALAMTAWLRQRFGGDLFLIASGGVHEPGDALALRQAGANLVQVDSGLVFSGPGLPKRINETLLFEETRNAAVPDRAERPAEMSWLWTLLMGGGMLLGSLLALTIAATRVVLPYDEAYLGMSRAELAKVNPRLLAFMAHDRVSLAGTMVAIGVMYVGLSLYGVRRGLHWAQLAIFFSAFTGFASFFLFLGFDYLDPLHAFVTLALLQLLLLGVHARLGTYIPSARPPGKGDHAWRRSLWGQLLLIMHGVGLLSAGATISVIAVTEGFVHEDLDFMHTTSAALRASNPRLVPLVAHDRATFGGMLLSSGWVFLLAALWGFRQGESWLWWTHVLAGLPAYAAGIGVHFVVGYTNLMHLLPAFAGLGLFVFGLSLSYSYLCDTA